MTEGPPPLAVVVVAYGPLEPLSSTLVSLSGHMLVVVDNASDPACATAAAAVAARYLDPGSNLGFAAAVNRALEVVELSSHDVLLLNPDAFITSDAVDALRSALRADPELAAVGPALRVAGSSHLEPARQPWHRPLRAWGDALGLRPRTDEGFLSGAVLLLRGEAVTDVGPFDERFFLYAEDEDWQRRALLKGWRLGHCADVEAFHQRGGTESSLRQQQLRLHAATEQYLRKWYGTRGWTLYRAGVVIGQLVRAGLRSGWRRSSAVALLRTYLIGPYRAARRAGALPTAPLPSI